MDLIIIIFVIIAIANKAKRKKREEDRVKNFSRTNQRTDSVPKGTFRLGKIIEDLTEIQEKDLYSNSTQNSGYDKKLAEEKYRQRLKKEELLQKRREKEKQQQLREQEDRRRRQAEAERKKKEQEEIKRRQRELEEKKYQKMTPQYGETPKTEECQGTVERSVPKTETADVFCIEHYLDPLTAPFYPGNEKKEKDTFCIEDYLFPSLASYYPDTEDTIKKLAAN